MILTYNGKSNYVDEQNRFVLCYGDKVELADSEAETLLKEKPKLFKRGDEDGTDGQNRSNIQE